MANLVMAPHLSFKSLHQSSAPYQTWSQSKTYQHQQFQEND